MALKQKFSDLSPLEAIPLLKELGDEETATALSSLIVQHPELINSSLDELPESEKLDNATWRGTEHTYGYIQNVDNNSDLLEIIFATTLQPDNSLRGQNINIKLGSVYTMNYPGWGRHNLLMHFKCKHAKENSNETVLIEFEQKFKSKEGEGAGNIGDFIFLGIRVPSNGLQFEIQTVNISNDGDEEALKVLESDTIKNGLDLVNASFATLAPFTKMAQGVLGLLLTRNQNKIVQQFTIGFDFDSNAVDIAKLRLGTYVVAQAKKNDMPWNEWAYQRSTGLVVKKSDHSIRLPFNHITFNVLKHSD
jgi:hypothetical protein